MGISPWVVGQTRPTWELTWNDDTGNPVDLTDATLTVRFFPYQRPSYLGAGNFNMINAIQGKFTYDPILADMVKQDSYEVMFIATFNDGSILMSDRFELKVLTNA